VVFTRIDDDRFEGAPVGQEVAVLDELAVGQ
jgi:hypothetical protein